MDDRIEALMSYLATIDRVGLTLSDFWAGWDAIAGSLADEVWSGNADPGLREAFTELLSAADDAGWMVPPEQMQA